MPIASALSLTRLGAACAACAALLLAGCAGPPEAPLVRPKPLLNTCPKPEYPRDALRNEQTGVTTLSLLVGEDGMVHDTNIQKSSGYPSLDRAALVLSHCRFTPATHGGKPVAYWEPMQFVWKLE